MLSGDSHPRNGDALLIVDVQNDFLPGGSLAVAEGDQVVAYSTTISRSSPGRACLSMPPATGILPITAPFRLRAVSGRRIAWPTVRAPDSLPACACRKEA